MHDIIITHWIPFQQSRTTWATSIRSCDAQLLFSEILADSDAQYISEKETAQSALLLNKKFRINTEIHGKIWGAKIIEDSS